MIEGKRWFALPALVLALGTLAACGDDDNGTPAVRSWTVRLASLSGAQETPPVASATAVGAGVLAVDEATGAARGFVLSSLTSATAAHIHPGARGASADPIVTLAGGPEVWVVPDGTTLTAEQVSAFRAGGLYFNVHTAANLNGEIRGQIDKAGTIKLASLNGAQEVPAPVGTITGYGAGMLAVGSAGEVAGFMITAGLTPSNGHVHQQARGTRGDVLVPLLRDPANPKLWVVADDRPALGADGQTAFTQGNLYFNAHTGANPDGEIRGQLDKSGTLRFASMNGAQETPSVTTTAVGAGVLSMGDAGAVAGFVVTTGLVDPTAAHVHLAPRGTGASVIVPLVPATGGGPTWVVADDRAALTADQQAAFTAGNLYFNAHTAANLNGEIRGQLD